jgi:hypothetical protein
MSVRVKEQENQDEEFNYREHRGSTEDPEGRKERRKRRIPIQIFSAFFSLCPLWFVFFSSSFYEE